MLPIFLRKGVSVELPMRLLQVATTRVACAAGRRRVEEAESVARPVNSAR
jgi:hypothetical protein